MINHVAWIIRKKNKWKKQNISFSCRVTKCMAITWRMSFLLNFGIFILFYNLQNYFLCENIFFFYSNDLIKKMFFHFEICLELVEQLFFCIIIYACFACCIRYALLNEYCISEIFIVNKNVITLYLSCTSACFFSLFKCFKWFLRLANWPCLSPVKIFETKKKTKIRRNVYRN